MTVVNPGGGGTSTPAFALGTAAARPAPAAGNNKTGYFATDTGELTVSDGATWNAIAQTTGNFKATNLLTTSGTTGFIFGNGANNLGINGNLDVSSAGTGVKVAEGANAKQGLSAAMVAGTVTVANTSITATSRIVLTRQEGGANPGAVGVSARVVGTSFTITSTNAGDTGQVAFEIFEPG